MADEKIIQVLLPVAEMAKSKAFYAEQLGFGVTADFGQGEHHWVTLALPGGGPALVLTTSKGNIQPGWMTLYLSTSDVEAWYTELKAKGVNVTEVKDNLYGPGSGVKWFNVIDPDGSTWVVAQA
jgi:predicted enzyme related to lactoylglutathione lyase